MFYFCLGLRLDCNYAEVVCPFRDNCIYYTNAPLSKTLSRPDEYTELNTYNDKECIYFNKEWLQKTEICETLDSQTDGMMTLLSGGCTK